MQLLNEIISNRKPVKQVKQPIDLGDGFSIKKIGFDLNGNWSYWISRNSNFKKVQHQAMENPGVSKIGDLRDIEHYPDTISAIKNHWVNYIEKTN